MLLYTKRQQFTTTTMIIMNMNITFKWEKKIQFYVTLSSNVYKICVKLLNWFLIFFFCVFISRWFFLIFRFLFYKKYHHSKNCWNYFFITILDACCNSDHILYSFFCDIFFCIFNNFVYNLNEVRWLCLVGPSVERFIL